MNLRFSVFFSSHHCRPLIARVFGSSQKKKKRASFGKAETKFFSPLRSDEKKAVHGATDPIKFKVVVTDIPVYKDWRRYHDAEFVVNFNESFEALSGDPDAALQIIHAALVADLLKDLDSEKLRRLACFASPGTSVPSLVSWINMDYAASRTFWSIWKSACVSMLTLCCQRRKIPRIPSLFLMTGSKNESVSSRRMSFSTLKL